MQDKAIRLALTGKDVLARARTGSGKTGAYVIPVVNKLLISKQVSISKVFSATKTYLKPKKISKV